VTRQKRNPKARAGLLAGALAAALLALPGTASAAVTSNVAAGDLTVTSDAGDAITITSVAGQVKVNGADPDSGAVTSANIDSIVVTGGPGNNVIDLTDVDAAAFPALTSVLLNGNGGEDTIDGSQLSDRIVGGDADDQSRGQGGDDTLVWNPGDDDDLNEGGDGNDTIEVNGGGGGEQFEIKPSTTPGRAQFDRTGPTPPGPFTLDIGTAERLDLNANGGDDTFNAAGGALGLALDIDGGTGNDTLDGGDGADLIKGGDDNDRIVGDDNPAGTRDESLGQAGDDTLVWNPGDDDDINEGGAGNDTVEVNGGGKEQFEVAPSATAGRVAFDRVQPDPTFGAPFSVDISDDTEKLDLNAAGGDDIVNSAAGLDALAFALDIDGGDGNDTLDGGDGADLIKGGAGNDRITADDNPAGTRDDSRGDAGDDTLVWNPGDDDDLNEGGDGNDTIEVNGGGGGEVFEVKPSTVAGRVLFDRTGPTPPGPFSLDIGTSERLDLNASGGDDSLNAAGPVDGLAGWTIDADGGEGNDTLAGGSQAVDVLSGGAGADTLRSRDQTADSLSGGTEVDSAVVDAQDTVNADIENVDRGQAQQPPAQDPPAQDPPAQDTVAPVVRIANKTVRVGRSRIVAVRLKCPAGEPEGCVIKIKLVRSGKSLGTKRISLDAGQTKAAKVKLTRKVFRQLKQREALNVRLALTATDDAGNTRKSSATLKLKLKR
jgi:Ca2+-binding RTX toxin-like protein